MKKKTVQRLVMMFAAANYCSSLASYGAAHPGERHEPAGGNPQAAAQQQEARSAQEVAVRAQEEQGRAAQQAAIRQQREMQQQSAKQSEHAQQEAAQQAAQQAERAQQAAIKEERQEQKRTVEEQHRAPVESFSEMQHKQTANFNEQQHREAPGFGAQEHHDQAVFNAEQHREQEAVQHPQQFATMEAEKRAVLQRQFEPRELPGERVPLERATSMPFLEPTASAAEREHFNAVQANLRQHLMAMPINQAPADYAQIQEQVLSNYANNYQFMLNNQMLRINRENTFFSPVPSYEYPSWWQPSPGWVFSNGFSLGNAVHAGLDWLRWGWHPYYGAPPEGFVCASNYIPTPWIYVPAYGLWRLAGNNAWAPSGPPFNYSGPITVEVLEPRHVRVEDPYTSAVSTNTINVPYLYNAFFSPQSDRWLYTNRHGYPVYVNL